MPTTRAMARQASVVEDDDKENANVLPPSRLGKGRRVPPRDAHAAKANTTMALSPKKPSQLPQTRGRAARPAKVDAAVAIKPLAANIAAQAPITSTRTRSTRSATEMAPAIVATRSTAYTRDPARTARVDDAPQGRAGGPIAGSNELNGANNQRLSTPMHPATHNRYHDGNRSETQLAQETWSRPLARASKAGSKPHPSSPRPFSIPSATSPALQAGDSDDELCGPKTPLHRTRHSLVYNEHANDVSTQHSIRQARDVIPLATPAAAARSHQTTPTRESDDQDSLTEKASLSTIDETSARRAMFVGRGSSVAYVFHSIPRASRVHSPLKGSYQWPVTPSDDEGDDPIDEAAKFAAPSLTRTSSRTGRPGTPSSSKASEPQARARLHQLFASASDSDSDSDSDVDSDDLDAGSSFDCNGADKLHEQYANADFEPEDASMSSSSRLDDAEADDSLEISIARPELTMVDDDSFDCTDVSDAAPRLRSEIFQSTPLQTIPIISHHHLESSPFSDDELAGTPTLTRLCNVPASQQQSLHSARAMFAPDDGSAQTPTARPVRPSLGAFKTPRMRTALDEFDMDLSMCSVDSAHTSQMVSAARAAIDPSMLSHQTGDGLASPRKDSVHVNIDEHSPIKLMTSVGGESASSQTTSLPPMSPESPHQRESTVRLSLLLDTDGLVESPRKEDRSLLDDIDSTVVVQTPPEQVGRGRLSGLGIDNSGADDSSLLDSSIIHMEEASTTKIKVDLDNDLFAEAQDETPNYAKPTISYDARRRSMPVFNGWTPVTSPQLRGPETAVKPRSTPFSPKLWLARQSERLSNPLSRRQSIISLSPTMHEPSRDHPSPHSALPRATPARRILGHHQPRHSVVGFENLATPSVVSAAVTPRPRCYTPTAVFATMRAASLTRSPSLSRGSPSPRTSPGPLQTSTSAPLLPPYAPALTVTPPPPPARVVSAPFIPPLTPHPSAPLSAVTAYVEVYTREGLPASTSFITALHRLGARTVKSFLPERVTHVVYKDGSPALLAKLRVARKDGWTGDVVNSRWVTDCDAVGARMPEAAEEYAVGALLDASGYGSATRRRSRCMEPQALSVEDGTGGRLSVGPGARRSSSRLSVASSVWAQSPVKNPAAVAGGFSSDEEENGQGDETEIDWNDVQTPGQDVAEQRRVVVPGSVPVQRFRTFGPGELDAGAAAARRRLTAWEERE